MRQLFLRWFGKKDIKEERSEEPSFLLGCAQGEPDSRDYFYTSGIYDTGIPEIPKQYTIPKLPPVRNQERIGSCCSHAVIGAYETMILNIKPHRFMEGSELYHYWNARHKINNTGDADAGMTIRDGCKTIHKFHMATENLWPYKTEVFNVQPSWIAYVMSGAYKIKEYQKLNSIEQIKYSLLENKPVVIGIKALQTIFGLNGKNYSYIPTGANRGGHAVLIVGYDDEKKAFLIRNSWGKHWGKEGYFEMKYQYLADYSFDWWRILI